MRKSLFTWILALVATLGMLRPEKALASHAAGGELMYKWVSGSTYDLYMKFYRDCKGINEPSTFTVCYTNICNNFQGTVTLNKVPAGPLPAAACGIGNQGSNVVNGCPQYPTTCEDPASTLPGYQEFWYTARVTLPMQCNFWRFATSESSRNNAVSNLTNASSADLYVEATLYNAAGTKEAPGNSSPCFTVKPVPYVNNSYPFSSNMGAQDPDGDSLVYQLIMPRDRGTGCNGVNLNFSSPLFNLLNNPFATGNSFSLNPSTGQINFISIQSQVVNIAILVKEYQNGVLRGTSMRDIQIISLPGTNRQPQPGQPATIVGGQINNGRYEGCAGQLLQFCFKVVAVDTNAKLQGKDNHNNPPPGTTPVAPGCTLVYNNQYTDSINVCFSWVPTGRDTGLHNIIITVRDTVCRPPGLPNQQTFSMPIYIFPTTEILSDTTICSGDSATLLAVGGTKFKWSVLPGGDSLGTLNCDSCASVIAKPSKTTRYVVVSNLRSVCGKNSDTVTVTVPEAPTFNRLPDQTTCVNSSVTLDIGLVPRTGTYYGVKWTLEDGSPATGLSSDTSWAPVASPRAPQTNYVVTVSPGGLARCAMKDTIIVYTLQGFDMVNPDTAVCLGSMVQVRGLGDPRYTYSWTPLSGAISSSNIIATAIKPATVGAVSYTIKAVYPGCPDSIKSFVIDAQPVPVFNLGAPRSFCAGDTARLNADVVPVYSKYIYKWTPSGVLSSSSIANPIFYAQQTAMLKLEVSTPAGCKDEDSVLYTVTPANFVRVSGDTVLCPGDSARLSVSGVSNATFVWRPALYLSDTAAAVTYAQPVTSAVYTVYAKDSIGCVDSGSVFVDVRPGAVINLPDTVYLYPGDSVQFNPQANGSNVLNYVWAPATGLDNPYVSNPIARPAFSTLYVAKGVTEFGCRTSDSVFVQVMSESLIQMPNAFAPSNNGASYYKAAREGIVALKSFRIFNRWGKLMFQTSNIDEGWDGKLNGDYQPMGVYIYMIEGVLPSGRTYYQQGDFTLIR